MAGPNQKRLSSQGGPEILPTKPSAVRRRGLRLFEDYIEKFFIDKGHAPNPLR